MFGATNLDVAEDSRSDGGLNGLEALPNHRIVTDIEYLSTARLNKRTGPIDKPVPQGLDSLKRPDRLSFAIRGNATAQYRPAWPHHGQRQFFAAAKPIV